MVSQEPTLKQRGSMTSAELVAAREAWPKWLTPEYAAIHHAIYNEMVKALEHCYESADAAGMDWTEEGWLSCSASNICGLLQRVGSPPPVVEPSDRLDIAAVHREWANYDYEGDDPA